MPRYDLSDRELREYRTSVQPPSDLGSFWSDTLAASRALAWEPKVDRIKSGLRLVETFDITFSGFQGEPIKAWFHRPTGAASPFPVVLHFSGYGGGRELAHQVPLWPLAGYACLCVDARGQGYSDTPDYAPFGPSTPGLLTHGILDPETYYCRRLYTDAVLAVDAARQLPDVNPEAIAAEGTSQGGGITLAVAALAEVLAVAMVNVPFLCDFPRALEISDTGPYQEIVSYLATHRSHTDRVFEVLAYFDGAVLASSARSPALFSVGLMDTWCPPSTTYAAFNAYGGPKELCRYPFNNHEGGQFEHEAEQLRWLPTVLSPAL